MFGDIKSWRFLTYKTRSRLNIYETLYFGRLHRMSNFSSAKQKQSLAVITNKLYRVITK